MAKESTKTLYGELFAGKVPAALQYAGHPVVWDALAWTMEENDMDAYLLETRSAQLDDRLTLTLHIRRYKQDAAIEWFFVLENQSAYDSDIVSAIDEANMQFLFDPNLSPIFSDANGSAEQLMDFFIHKTQMFHRAHRSLKAEGGRSSSYTMPYFHLDIGAYGYLIAIGWSGQWRAHVLRQSDEGIISFSAGMEDGHFRLHPGEKVALPRITVLRWEGGEQDGYNAWRRFAFRHIVPKMNGNPVQSPICLYAWGGSPAQTHLTNFETIKRHGIKGDLYWIDAGWFGEAPLGNSEDDGSWYRNAGVHDWAPNPLLYPNGMEEIAQGARDAGLGLLLWYEPERSRTNAKRSQEHPTWYLGSHMPNCDLLLNLGHPEARAWLTGLLREHIRQLDIKCLRIDFNLGPLPLWRRGDAPDRQGMTELLYNAGLYQMWDELLAEFPELIIDNCASGGRRLDYEALRRSIPLFRTDYACFGDSSREAATQLQTYYLNQFVPVNATSTGTCDVYRFRSTFASAITISAPNPQATPEDIATLKKRMAEAYRMREYVTGDYWPLTGGSYSEKDWMAYQMDTPEVGKGMMVAYRRAESMVSTLEAELHGVEPDAHYRLEDLDAGDLGTVSGKTLQNGWALTIPKKRTCRVIFYEKVRV